MTEALRLVIRYGFSSLRLNRIQALVVPGNEASMGLLLKLGFSLEGLLRDIDGHQSIKDVSNSIRDALVGEG